MFFLSASCTSEQERTLLRYQVMLHFETMKLVQYFEGEFSVEEVWDTMVQCLENVVDAAATNINTNTSTKEQDTSTSSSSCVQDSVILELKQKLHPYQLKQQWQREQQPYRHMHSQSFYWEPKKQDLHKEELLKELRAIALGTRKNL